MYDLRLPPAELDEVVKYLMGSHRFSVRVQLMDLDHNYLANLSDKVMDGQVSVNWSGEEATRSLELSVFDPDFDLGFDTSEFTDGIWFLDRMVQVVVEFYVPALARVIEVPIFTGPVRGYKRKKSIVTLKCLGKDIFSRQAWIRYVVKKGTNQVTAMRDVLEELGETKFRFEATTTTRIKKDKVVDKSAQQTPWGWCRSVAKSLGMRIYYDGEGYVCLRKIDNDRPVFTFRDGDGGSVLGDPDAEGDYSRLANVVLSQGPAVGNNKAPKGKAVVASSSAISPQKLRRGGKPVYFGVTIVRDSITSTTSANTAAKNELADRQRVGYEIGFDSLVLWMLEEGDVIALSANGLNTVSTIVTFSLGLSPTASMPVGYKKLVAPTLAKIRRI